MLIQPAHAVVVLLSVCWAFAVVAQEITFDRLFIDGMEPFQGDIMRISPLQLRDPHLFADVIVCIDVTSDFNDQINLNINQDNDADGLLDASPLLLMEPFAPPQAGQLAQADGACTAPVAGTRCSILLPAQASPFAVAAEGLCRAALPATSSDYQPPVPTIAAPCFSDRPTSRSISLDGLQLALQEAVVSGSYDTTAPTAINAGMLRGFVTETAAEAILIPADVPIIGAQPLASLLPGGAGNCATGDDRDILNGESGWWFYFSYQAERAAGL